MAYVPKDKKIVNDTTPMMCTIEGIAKKDHVVRRKLVYCANVSLICSELLQIMFLVRLCRRITL